jgi:putative transposase
LAWRGEVSQDVFECASVDAAQALANFAASRTGKRKGKRVAFPRFKTQPRRARRVPADPGRRAEGAAAADPRRDPCARLHCCTRTVRRMLDAGRLHLYSVAIRFERGRWWVSLTGLAAPFHPARRASAGRHPRPAGLDRGVKSLAVVADTDGVVLHVEKG